MADRSSVVGGGVDRPVDRVASRPGRLVGAAVHDPRPGSGASWVAGGMLAPLSEGWPGEDAVLRARGRLAGPLARIRRRARGRVRRRRCSRRRSSLTVALDGADAADLRTIAEWVAAPGRRPGTARPCADPGRSSRCWPRTSGWGCSAATELAVDNRALIEALRRLRRGSGWSWSPRPSPTSTALGRRPGGGRRGHRVARALWPGLPVRPVKGEILRLRARPGVRPPRADHPRQRARSARLPGAARRRPRRRRDPVRVRATTPRSPSPVCAT